MEFHREVVCGAICEEENESLSSESPISIERKDPGQKRVFSEVWDKMIRDLKKDAINVIRKDIRREISQEIKKEIRKDWGRSRRCFNKPTKKRALDENVEFAPSNVDQNMVRPKNSEDQLSLSMDTWYPFTKSDSYATKNEINNNGQ